MYINNNEEYLRTRHALLFRFNLLGKYTDYQNSPNSIFMSDDSSVAFCRTIDETIEYEEYRVVDLYGHTSMQLKKNNDSCFINLRCFPEGAANYNRGALIVSKLQDDGSYNTFTLLMDDVNLTDLSDLDSVLQTSTKELTSDYIKECFEATEDFICTSNYEFLKPHLDVLDKLFGSKKEDVIKLMRELPSQVEEL